MSKRKKNTGRQPAYADIWSALIVIAGGAFGFFISLLLHVNTAMGMIVGAGIVLIISLIWPNRKR